MRKLIILVVVTASLALLFTASCSDRGSNSIPKASANGAIAPWSHVFYQELTVQLKNRFQQFFMNVYIPGATFQQEPLPVLILLPPQDGDEFYFFNHGLKQLADELIADGTIKPMAIVCLRNDKTFGGYFWAGNGGGSGNYDTLIGGTLIDYLNATSMGLFLDSPAKRGIGGVGMGSYGAFRAAMLHQGVFSSISVTDGPLDFDGANGNSGLISLFDDALAEQGLTGVDGWTSQFDTSGAWHISRLLIGGAMAFSPHDTLVLPIVDSINNLPDKPPIITLPEYDSLGQQRRWVITDSSTLITNIVTSSDFNLDFHLPFDSLGQPYQPIWDLWLRNNLETILADSGTSVLENVNIWFGVTKDPQEQSRTYGEQTRSWISTLEGIPTISPNVQVYEYSGYDDRPATSDQYVYDLLREMLIFHSNNFEN